MRQVVGKLGAQVSVHEVDVGEAESKAQIVIQLNEILDRAPNSSQRIFNNILAELAPVGNRHRVRINHAEALLEDGALRLSGVNFFFASVAVEMALELGVNDKDGLELVNVFALGTLCVHVSSRVDVSASDLGKLGLNVETEGAEVTNVDGPTLTEVVVQVSGQCFPDNQHLSFYFYRSLIGICALGRSAVHSRVFVSLRDNVVANVFDL